MSTFSFWCNMLVYLKQPMGYTEIEGKRIYGKFYNYGRMGPTKASKEFYWRNKEYLIPVFWDSDTITKVIGRQCPAITPFTYSNMSELTEEEIKSLCAYFSIDYEGIMSDVYEKYRTKIWEVKTQITNKLEEVSK